MVSKRNPTRRLRGNPGLKDHFREDGCQDLGRSNRRYPIEALGVSYVPVDLRRLASRARIPIS